MFKDKLITLDNGSELLILTELDVVKRKFVLGVDMSTVDDNFEGNNFIVKEIVGDSNNYSVQNINDPLEVEIYSKLLLTKAHDESLKVE